MTMNDNNFPLRKKNSYENNCRMKTKQKKTSKNFECDKSGNPPE